MDREAWHAAIHEVTKSWTRLRDETELMLRALGLTKDNTYRALLSSFRYMKIANNIHAFT